MRPTKHRTKSLAVIGWMIITALIATLPGATPAQAVISTKTYDTVADFPTTCAGDPPLAGTTVTNTGNGEIALAPTIEDTFDGTSLNASLWKTEIYNPGTPVFTVAGGQVAITGSTDGGGAVRSISRQHYGRLEGTVTFSDGMSQHFGWAEPGFTNFIIFSTAGTDDQLFVRTPNGGGNVLIQDPLVLVPQLLAIEWSPGTNANTDKVEYFINNASVRVEDNLPQLSSTLMEIVLSTDTRFAKDLSANVIRYFPYDAATGTYTSCPFSAAGTPDLTWGQISWNATTPTNTSVAISVETSNDATSWSGPVAVTNNTLPNVPDSKYIRFIATLDKTNTVSAPTLNSLSIQYSPLPTITIGDVTQNEGNTGTPTMDFTVTLSETAARDVTVQYTTANNTATSGSDYTTESGTLTILSGQTSGTISVPIVGNTTVEPTETFFVNLTTPTHATIADNQAVGTITNDDSTAISIADVTQNEGNTGTSAFDFTVSMTNPSATDVTVSYATANGTATAGTDYTAASGTLTIPAGSTSETISVSVNGDTTVEGDETFVINLTNPVGATISDNQATGTITNNDTTSLSIANVTQSEGTTPFGFTVSLTNPSATDITVNYATANDTAAAPGDYTTTSGTLTIPAGQTTATINVPVTGDTVVELNETFFVNLSNLAGATLADGQAIGTINNDDTTALSIADASVTEGNAGTVMLNFTVSLTNLSASNVTVNYTTSNGSAIAPTDYTAAVNTLFTIPAGQPSGTISISVNGDTTVEANETFLVTLSTPTGATISDGQATGTITNDDGATVTIGDLTLAEGDSGTQVMSFPVTLTAASSTAVDITYATADGTATASSDYTATSGTLTILAGELTGTIDVTINGDTAVEPDEAFVVNLTGATGATIADNQATGTITNDDGTTITIADASMAEGNSGTTNLNFTVSLGGTVATPVQVDYILADGTATAGSDYTATSGTLTIPPGELTGTISVSIMGDTTIEPNETFVVNLSNAVGATITDNQATGTITNDDAISITIGDVSMAEGNSGTTNMVFTVTLSSASSSQVQVVYATANGSATAGSDYAPKSGTLTFSPGTTTQTVAISITGDTTVELDETFVVNLSNAAGAIIADNQATGTITNDDTTVEYKAYLPLVQR